MASSWKLDFASFDLLQENISKLPNRAEDVLNDVIHDYGVEISEENIRSLIKKSEKDKKHAKDARKLLNTTNINLGFVQRPVSKYAYLVFPDLGIGTSFENEPQEFMHRGLEEQASPLILSKANEELLKEINETIGGI